MSNLEALFPLLESFKLYLFIALKPFFNDLILLK